MGEGPHGKRKFIDGIVAAVDGTVILDSQVQEKVHKGPLVVVSPSPALDSALSKEKALQDEINMSIILRKCKELEITVEESKVDEHITRILEQNKTNLDGLKEFLRQQGKSFPSYRQDIKNQILLMHFRGRVLMPLVKVTERDIENYYAKKTGTSAETISLHLRQLSFPARVGTSAYGEQEKKAQVLYKSLSDSKDKKAIEKALAAQDASLMVVKAKDLAPQIRAEVESLGEGQISKPIATGDGLYLVYVERKDFADSGKFAEQKEALENELRQNELAVQLERWLAQERSKSKITIMDQK
jgi:peptidyl-prolyl cis-trans isomerase SurA